MIMGRRPLILLVEDDLNDIELIKLALASQLIPNHLEIVHDGEAALKYLSNPQKQLPDLVLLDLYLPKVNGLEVLKKIRSDERTKELPIVIFTASREQRDLMRSYDLGANAFIKKGLEPEEFKEALKNLDVYWLVQVA